MSYNRFDVLSELADQKNAEDKVAALSGKVYVFAMALFVTSLLYLISIKIFPCPMLENISAGRSALSEKYTNMSEKEKQTANDLMGVVESLVEFFLAGTTVGCGAIWYYKKKRKARQREMQKLMEAELERIKNEFQEEVVAGKGGSKATSIAGVNLVELFNSFADVMSKFPGKGRDDGETAQEYFVRLAKSMGASEVKVKSASHLFDDELYGKHTSSASDRQAFMEIILMLMSKGKK